MSKKRKGSESEGRVIVLDEVTPTSEAKAGNIRSHFSDGLDRISKKCKEDASDEPNVRCAGIATAPPCSSQSALGPSGRGLKRKIGCIEARTQTGRKNKMENDYLKGAAIGHGKFGSVYLCKSKATGAEFACKTLRKGEDPVHREVEIMQHLSGHPGVVTLQAVYEEAECFHLVMELCSGGRLIDQMQVVGTYTEQRAANILKEVMLVVKYCHEMGVVHRDIKPENILLTSSGKVKLADFGLSMRISNGQTLSGKAGSPAYVAPEVLSGDYCVKVDVWSAGVLLHALLVGALPFRGDSLEDVFEAIKNVKLDFSGGIWEPISKPARDLIGRMLTRDVSARMTADEVLSHPWIRLYTDRTLKTLPFKSKSKNQNGPTPSPPCKASVLKHDEQKFQARSSTGSLSCKSEEQDEFGIVDALAMAVSRVNISEPSKSQSNMTPQNLQVLTAAISHVNISGPKRSRLCVPSGTSKQQSYMTPNNLCRAF